MNCIIDMPNCYYAIRRREQKGRSWREDREGFTWYGETGRTRPPNNE